MHKPELTKPLALSLIATALTTISLLFWQAAHFSAQQSAMASFGPFNLISIQKIPLSGGIYQLTFSPLTGIIWLEATYFAACLVCFTFRSNNSPP